MVTKLYTQPLSITQLFLEIKVALATKNVRENACVHVCGSIDSRVTWHVACANLNRMKPVAAMFCVTYQRAPAASTHTFALCMYLYGSNEKRQK